MTAVAVPPATFSVTATQGYVSVVVEGPFTRELALEVGFVATRVAKVTGLNRYLYDLRASRNVVSVLGNYEFAHTDMPASGLDPRALVALLVAPEDRSHGFVAVVMQNQGYRVHLFRDHDEAIRWLNG